jgi:hypothetical protein
MPLPPSATVIPRLVCPSDGLPPLGVNRVRNHLARLVSVALLVWLFALVVRAGRGVLGFDLALVTGWWVAIALHEIGHATAAHVRGFRVISIFVGPVFATRAPGGGVRLGWRGSLLDGAVLAAPRRWDGPDRFSRDFFWFVAVGPATSLVIGSVGLIFAHPSSVMWLWSVNSVVIGATSLIPARYPSGRTTDGEKLHRLRHASATDAPLTALLLMANVVPPRDWDGALVAVANTESESHGSQAIDATALLYHRAVDCDDIPLARTLMQRLIDYTCGTARWPRTTISMEVGFEACLFEAAWRGDLTAAAEWLARAPFPKEPATTVSDAIEKFAKSCRRDGHPMVWLCHRATLERLSSSSSS